MVITPAIDTGTLGVAPQDAGVAAAAVSVGGAVIAGALLRPGPLDQQGTPSQAHGKAPTAQATACPPVRHDPAGRYQHLQGCRREVGAVVLRSRESP
jgi:hypothetical protein